MGKYFCSDGFRGIANEQLLPVHAYRVGRVIGGACRASGGNSAVVIGRDTRCSCDLIESAFLSGVLASGADAFRAGVIPTNGIAFLTKENGFRFGVMITASHNSYENNGIKIFDACGEKISDQLTQEIEEYLDGDDLLPLAVKEKIGRIIEYPEGREQYIRHISSKIGCRAQSLKIGLDCANGAASPYAGRIFETTGAELHIIHNTPDGRNINESCGAIHPEEIRQYVLREKLDVGFAFDGDADRCIAVDGDGNLIDGDQMLYILSRELLRDGTLMPKAVCATEMSNAGIVGSLSRLGVECMLSATGDHAMYGLMKKERCMLGAERIGHVIMPAQTPSSDGMFTALMLLNAMQHSGQTWQALLSGYRELPQVRYSIPTALKVSITGDPSILELVQCIRAEIGKNGRVVFRPSGIDDMVRILVECEDEVYCQTYADQIREACLAKLQRLQVRAERT